MKRTRVGLSAVLGICCVSACTGETARPLGGSGDTGGDNDQVTPPRPVDLLFIVDNSAGMEEEQDIVTGQFEPLVRELLEPTFDSDSRVLPPAVEDLHVGVVATDMGSGGYTVPSCDDPVSGDAGALQADGVLPGCEASFSAADCHDDACPWLLHSTTHPDDDPADDPIWADFACIASLGGEGCTFVQALEAVDAAVAGASQPGNPNDRFLRQDSVVAIVFVTVHDDCSAASPGVFFDPAADQFGPIGVRCALNPSQLVPVGDTITALQSLRADQDLVVVAALAGIPIDGSWTVGDPLADLQALVRTKPGNPNELAPSCDTALGEAFPPPRLVELVYGFGDAGHLASSCEDDVTPALTAIARRIQRRLNR